MKNKGTATKTKTVGKKNRKWQHGSSAPTSEVCLGSPRASLHRAIFFGRQSAAQQPALLDAQVRHSDAPTSSSLRRRRSMQPPVLWEAAAVPRTARHLPCCVASEIASGAQRWSTPAHCRPRWFARQRSRPPHWKSTEWFAHRGDSLPADQWRRRTRCAAVVWVGSPARRRRRRRPSSTAAAARRCAAATRASPGPSRPQRLASPSITARAARRRRSRTLKSSRPARCRARTPDRRPRAPPSSSEGGLVVVVGRGERRGRASRVRHVCSEGARVRRVRSEGARVSRRSSPMATRRIVTLASRVSSAALVQELERAKQCSVILPSQSQK